MDASCSFIACEMNCVSDFRHPEIWSHLFRATTKGTFLLCRILRLSFVCGWNPRFTSTTSMAMSAAEPPRERRFVNISWPGVSITRIPGTLFSDCSSFCTGGRRSPV